MITKPINETLPATGAGAVLVSLPAGVTCKGWAVQARGSVNMKLSDVLALTTYWTVKSGQSFYLEDMLGPNATLFYAESAAAEDVVEVVRKPRD